MRAHPGGKPPPTGDEVAEAKRIRDAKRAGTMTDADYDSLAGPIGKESATGKKPTGEELRKYIISRRRRSRRNLRSLRRLLRCRLRRSLTRRRMMGRSRLRKRLRDGSLKMMLLCSELLACAKRFQILGYTELMPGPLPPSIRAKIVRLLLLQ